jgi:hypothetical protein
MTRAAGRRSAALIVVSCATLMGASAIRAQTWDSLRAVDLVSAQPSPETDEAVLVELGPGFDYGNAQAGGEDVRIAEEADGVFCVPLWIETWNESGASRIWVTSPWVPPGASTLHMFYGNPSASSVSEFGAVFPDALVVTDGAVLSGTLSHDSVEIPAATTASLSAGTAVVIEARRVVVDGTIDGVGRGFPAGAPSLPGAGPGGGGTSADAGSGGGGYGGVGGQGGFDPGDTPGAGGPVYGTTGVDVDLGSGGGSSDNTSGGDGGGALTIVAERVRVSGTIDLDAGAAEQPGGSRGGGGGSGGGLLIHGYDLDLTGASLSARGSNGSTGTIPANDSGGGGGGGRIKLYHEAALAPPVAIQLEGGLGGPNGGGAAGENGATGTSTISDAVAFPEVLTAVGPAVTISLSGLCTGIFRDGFESADTSRWRTFP